MPSSLEGGQMEHKVFRGKKGLFPVWSFQTETIHYAEEGGLRSEGSNARKLSSKVSRTL